KGEIEGAASAYHRIWDDFAATARAGGGRVEPPFPSSRPKVPLHPVIYMPVEIKQREFVARVLTACYAASRGLSSVIAPTRSLDNVSRNLPAGTFLHKTMFRLDRYKVGKAIPAGHL